MDRNELKQTILAALETQVDYRISTHELYKILADPRYPCVSVIDWARRFESELSEGLEIGIDSNVYESYTVFEKRSRWMDELIRDMRGKEYKMTNGKRYRMVVNEEGLPTLIPTERIGLIKKQS